MLLNQGRQWQNLLGCDHCVLSGAPEPTMVGFHNLVGVGIGTFSKKLAVKVIDQLLFPARKPAKSVQVKKISSTYDYYGNTGCGVFKRGVQN